MYKISPSSFFLAFFDFVFSLFASCSCGLVGIQFDSPDGPGSAKSSSDKSNCCGLRFLDGGFEGRTLSSSDVLEDVQEETDGSFSMHFLPLRFLFFSSFCYAYLLPYPCHCPIQLISYVYMIVRLLWV